MKFLSTCNLLMWISRVCRLWFNWISFKSSLLRTFLFWDNSILVKLVWRFLWSVVVWGFDLTWVCPHYLWVIRHSYQYHLILWKAIWWYCQKQIILTFAVPVHLHLNCHQRSGLIFSWIGIVNWLSMLRSVWPLQCIQLGFYGKIGFCSFLHRRLVGHC